MDRRGMSSGKPCASSQPVFVPPPATTSTLAAPFPLRWAWRLTLCVWRCSPLPSSQLHPAGSCVWRHHHRCGGRERRQAGALPVAGSHSRDQRGSRGCGGGDQGGGGMGRERGMQGGPWQLVVGIGVGDGKRGREWDGWDDMWHDNGKEICVLLMSRIRGATGWVGTATRQWKF